MVIYEVDSSSLAVPKSYYKNIATALKKVKIILNKLPNTTVRITKVIGQNEKWIIRTKKVK